LGEQCEVSQVLGGDDGKSDAVAPDAWLWPDGDIYLIIDRSELGWWSGYWVNDALEDAAEELAENTAVRIHLIEDPAESSHGFYVRLKAQPEGGGWAYYGTSGTEAEASATAVHHELGHIVGLAHTQSRGDRDEHVVIHWDWIEQGKAYAFDERSSWKHVGPYDFSSIMHYGSLAFSTRNGDGDLCATITRVSTGADPDDCVTFSLLDMLGSGSYVEAPDHYSKWDFTVIAALYCDPRLCGDNCASSQRCTARRVQDNIRRLTDWEASPEGQAWRERYPSLVP